MTTPPHNPQGHKCLESDIKIVELTDDYVKATCLDCGKTKEAYSKDYFDFEWRRVIADARKHKEGYYNVK